MSVILAPVEPASGDDLIVIRDLIRSELENQGIAEPDVRVQGQAIVVDLPGVKDQQQALDAVDVSGVVELRPVVEPASAPPPCAPDDVTDHHDRLRHGTGRSGHDDRRRRRPLQRPHRLATAPAGFRGAFPAQTVPAPEPVATEPVTALPTGADRDRRRTAADA